MKLRILSVALLVCAGGCDRIPGTNAYLIRHAEKFAADQLIDPSSAMFRNESVHNLAVCGEINGKNRMGAYAGFTRFLSLKDSDTALVDPQADPSDAASAEELCNSARSNDYSSPSLVQESCQRASEEQAKQSVQDTFNTMWKGSCQNT
ncbi:hypothetical protein [Sphingomonas sp.]|uniref:hypothetical protein n=1 Tax=Sphingomonas sp. TaxID=28214 RepID=UPI0025E811A1|nr:hypothetical protein [Sphingomonas sp.]MBV9527350.1 hypothetical protein [Sphingomonas sp.]